MINAAIEGLQTRTNTAAEIDSGIFYSLTLFGLSVHVARSRDLPLSKSACLAFVTSPP
jgi:hypothetical protein